MNRDKSPRGSIVCSTRGVEVGEGSVGEFNRKATIVVYIKSGSGNLAKRFHHFCQRNGINARPVWDVGQVVLADRADAYECIGSADALARLVGEDGGERMEAVIEWHFPLNVRAPRCAGTGSGEKTKKLQEMMRPKAQRQLMEDARYTADAVALEKERWVVVDVRGERTFYVKREALIHAGRGEGAGWIHHQTWTKKSGWQTEESIGLQ